MSLIKNKIKKLNLTLKLQFKKLILPVTKHPSSKLHTEKPQ